MAAARESLLDNIRNDGRFLIGRRKHDPYSRGGMSAAPGRIARHLRKAREFLEAADVELSGGLYSAAASSAVLAGINAKDALCLRLTGRTGKTDNHTVPIGELAKAGPAGKRLEATFRRLLGMKTTAQYQATPIQHADAHKAVEWATRMVDAAADAFWA